MNYSSSNTTTSWVKLTSLLFLFFLCFGTIQAQEIQKKADPEKANRPPSKEMMEERKRELEKNKAINSKLDRKPARTTTKEKAPPLSDPLTADCLDRVIGVKHAFALFHTKYDQSNRASFRNAKEDCTCVLLKNPKLEGCADIGGMKLIKIDNPKVPEGFHLTLIASKPTMEKDDPRIANDPIRKKVAVQSGIAVRITPLTGHTNCRLFTENNKYLISQKERVGSTTILPEKQITISTDGDQAVARWDFIPVSEEDPNAGFFMVTREKVKRAIMRNGQQLVLHPYKNMDGKAQDKSKWNYFIGGADKNGNTRYILYPHNDASSAISVDERTGVLSLKRHKVKEDLFNTDNAKANAMLKNMFWKVECIF